MGLLPWQGARSRPYSTEITRDALKLSMESIKLIHEELDDGCTQSFKEAKELMQNAELIYFFGFVFGQLNIDRLGLIKLPNNITIATAYGFTQHEVGYIRKRCDERISIYPDRDIEVLFRNNV